MSCYGCGAEFSFFKKEHGCKNCGFSFCSNCLTKKTAVPKLNGSKHHVCNKCYNILTGKVSAEDKQQYSPPKAYMKRVAALEERESQGGATTKRGATASRPDPKYASLDKPDREIAQRLERLKEKPEKQQPVTDTDLNTRLAKLKGEDPAIRTAPTKPFYQPPDRRTQVEQIDDLLDEIANEVEIDSHMPDPATEVQARLDRLRGDNKSDADKEQQNNLDKNGPATVKNYVKNINVSADQSNTSNTGEEGQLDMGEVQRLMERAAGQLEQDAQRELQALRQDKELMDRLAQVSQRHKNSGEQAEDSTVDNEEEEDSEDEEKAAQKVLLQYLAEAKLDEKAEQDLASCSKGATSTSTHTASNKAKGGKEESGVDSDYEDPDELPYCIICTEDAAVRCIDCDMDLYCSKCFRDYHKELGLADHRSVPFKMPKGYS